MIFLFATELEAEKFRTIAPHATIVICGVGAAECAATTAEIIAQLRERNEQKRLILAGIAGSYSPTFPAVTQVVEVVSEYIAALPPRFAVTYATTPQTSLPCVSSNSVNREFEGATSAQIENMEGAAFMAVCQRFNVDAIQIRAISNIVGEPFNQWKIDEACRALAVALNHSLILESSLPSPKKTARQN